MGRFIPPIVIVLSVLTLSGLAVVVPFVLIIFPLGVISYGLKTIFGLNNRAV
jgi:hypothetical protein